MKLTVTGNRPQKIGGFNNYSVHRKIYKRIKSVLETEQPEIVYTGMALGVDQWTAQACLTLGIPYVACLPFKGQELKWTPKLQQDYKYLLRKAAKIVYVDREAGYISSRAPPDVYHSGKMMARNRWMVDQLEEGDILLAVYNIYDIRSGTRMCVNYAHTSGLVDKVRFITINTDEYLPDYIPF